MKEWISVKESLPDYDKYVIWCHESGYMFYECIDKDWDAAYLEYFLGGYGNGETSGRVTHWIALECPEGR